MSQKKGKFVHIKTTMFSDLKEGAETFEIPESDLCFQNEEMIVQLRYVEPDEKDEVKYEIKPGVYSIAQTNSGVKLDKMELRTRDLLTSAINTTKITNEARTFFNRLHVYEKLNRPKKRSLLLYSGPGMGKSSSITQFCTDAVAEDAGTVVLNWPTSEVEAENVSNFLSKHSFYTPECTRLILIIEDIGGGEREGGHSRNAVNSGLLNLLDGIDVVFKLPTFIISTTNYPENLLSALADRPGRFDMMMELQAPNYEEKIKLLEFIAKRPLLEEEKAAFKIKGAGEFSIAHLEECIIRSELQDKTVETVVRELVAHKEKYKESFEEKSKGGMGFGGSSRYDD